MRTTSDWTTKRGDVKHVPRRIKTQRRLSWSCTFLSRCWFGCRGLQSRHSRNKLLFLNKMGPESEEFEPFFFFKRCDRKQTIRKMKVEPSFSTHCTLSVSVSTLQSLQATPTTLKRQQRRQTRALAPGGTRFSPQFGSSHANRHCKVAVRW